MKEIFEKIWKEYYEKIWNGKKTNLLIIAAIGLVFLCLIVGIIGGNTKEEVATEKLGPTHVVKLSVDFEGNFLFDKYDVIFKIDGERYDTLEEHFKDASSRLVFQ